MLEWYISIGLSTGVMIVLMEASALCIDRTLPKICRDAIIGTIFWLPLIIIVCGFLIYDFHENLKTKKQEREKVQIFNDKFKVGQLVEINFLNTYRWRNTLGEAKLVKLYYGHRACIPSQFGTMDNVMIDFKHVTAITPNGGIVK